MFFEYENELRYVPSGKEEDILRSPIVSPLGFNIDDDIVERLNTSLNQLFVTRQKEIDMTIVARHLLTTVVQYINKR